MAHKKPVAHPSVPAFERPLVTVDVVIFMVIDEQLKVPLVRRPDAAGDPHPGRLALRKRLAFDHAEILAAAVERLRGKVEYTSLPACLLPEPFTLPQLHRTCEIVLGRPVDKSAFRKRMLDRERAAVFPRTFRSVEVPSTKD